MKKIVGKGTLYPCTVCGFWYRKKSFAKKCREWCEKNKSCNVEIIKHAVKKGKG